MLYLELDLPSRQNSHHVAARKADEEECSKGSAGWNIKVVEGRAFRWVSEPGTYGCLRPLPSKHHMASWICMELEVSEFERRASLAFPCNPMCKRLPGVMPKNNDRFCNELGLGCRVSEVTRSGWWSTIIWLTSRFAGGYPIGIRVGWDWGGA